MKRSAPLRRGSPIKRTSAPKRKTAVRKKSKERPAELLRTHGTPEFRQWVKQQPCSACGVVGYSDGAHVLGNGGLSRKKDWTTIAPLCGPHAKFSAPLFQFGGSRITMYEGCHWFFDNERKAFAKSHPTYRPKAAAAANVARWDRERERRGAE